jgi:hypothetical protein
MGVLLAIASLLAIPLVGVWLAGQDVARFLEFPPTTQYVAHAPFSPWIFAIMLLGIAVVVLPFVVWDVLHACLDRERVPTARAFPKWGWAGILFGLATWVLAWGRLPCCESVQPHLFTFQWLSYIVIVNALKYRKTGECMLTQRTRYWLALFVWSAVFWWFFEYLNRFVQNWFYDGVVNISPTQYFVRATFPFATVLPAVLGTYELLSEGTRAGRGLEGIFALRLRRPRLVSAAALVLAVLGLGGIGVWPDLLFPLLWVSPLIIISAGQSLCGLPTIFSPVAEGNWRRLYLLGIGALICGFFWEMWNFYSVSKWVYSVPFVNRFPVFEMPILGYAGYLPFGLECAVIGDLVARTHDREPGRTGRGTNRRRHSLLALSLLLATLLWLPLMHVLFKPAIEDYRNDGGLPGMAKAIAAQQHYLLASEDARRDALSRMRKSNAEWDFMGRTFSVLAMANMALRDPGQEDRYLTQMNRIIDETLRLERENGIYYFLMEYAKRGRFVSSMSRSLFLDGEIALMIGARRMLREDSRYRSEFSGRIALMRIAMEESPVLSGESYPDECWMFCNTVALAAMRMSDALDGTDHNAFFERWLTRAKSELTDPETGLLFSSFTFRGQLLDGPEGSSLWMSAHCLQLVDRDFARTQYDGAKRELAKSFLGFGYAREWPASWKGVPDVDSGPIIPLLEISAGASGLAILGASAFEDDPYLSQLLTSLNFGAFPIRQEGRLRYAASNQVGDAVLLYALVVGPLWEEVWRRVG